MLCVCMPRCSQSHLIPHLGLQAGPAFILRQAAKRRFGGPGGTAAAKIVQNVHKIDVGIVRRVIWVKILMDITVGKVLRTHIIEMVGYLQFPPVCDDIFVAGVFDFFLEPIELVNGI